LRYSKGGPSKVGGIERGGKRKVRKEFRVEAKERRDDILYTRGSREGKGSTFARCAILQSQSRGEKKVSRTNRDL